MKSLKPFKTLKANSLIESVIAITIISACILVAFMVYLNVTKQNNTIKYYEAKHTIDRFTQEAISQGDYEDNFYTFKGYTINKAVSINDEDETALLTWTIKTVNKTYVVNNLIPHYEQ